MSSEHNDTSDERSTSASPPRQVASDDSTAALQRIAAELAALGEAPLSDDDVASPNAESDPDVRTVQTLVSLGQPLPDPLVRPLSELELARVYRRVATRIPAAARADRHDAAPAANDSRRSRRSMVTALTVIAAAAAFVVLPQRGKVDGLDTPQRRAKARSSMAASSEAARAGLAVFGPSGSARATAMAAAYAERIEGTPNAGTPSAGASGRPGGAP